MYFYSDINDLQEWIVAFNKAAALFSAPPLAAPIGSGYVLSVYTCTTVLFVLVVVV